MRPIDKMLTSACFAALAAGCSQVSAPTPCPICPPPPAPPAMVDAGSYTICDVAPGEVPTGIFPVEVGDTVEIGRGGVTSLVTFKPKKADAVPVWMVARADGVLAAVNDFAPGQPSKGLAPAASYLLLISPATVGSAPQNCTAGKRYIEIDFCALQVDAWDCDGADPAAHKGHVHAES